MRAAIYCRISSDRFGAGLGVATQEADCREVADQLGWEVAVVHTDNDVSAYSGKPRPGYRALLRSIESREVGAVIAWHTDRLHRSLTELEEYVALLERAGVTTQTVKAGHLDLATPSGRLVARQLGAVARYEVEHQAERQRRAKRRSAEAGKYKGSRRPYGYEADGITVRPDEAEAIREATSALLAGASVRGLADRWNQEGRRTSMDNPWHPNALRVTMLKARNAGLMVHQGHVVGPAEWDAIVPEEQWRALVAKLEDPARRTVPMGWARRWLGSGLYRCGCGQPVICASTNHYPAYRCRPPGCGRVSRKQDEVDAYVADVITARLRTPDLTARLNTPPATAPRPLEDEAVALRSRLDSLAAMFADDLIDAQQLATGTRTLNVRLAEVRTEIARQFDGPALQLLGPAVDPGQAWFDAPLDTRRAVLAALCTVTLLPGSSGRPPGWRPGHSYFRRDLVRIKWKQVS